MISFLDRSRRLCDGLARRELLTVGGLSLVGLGLPELLRQQQTLRADQSGRGSGFGAADATGTAATSSSITRSRACFASKASSSKTSD